MLCVLPRENEKQRACAFAAHAAAGLALEAAAGTSHHGRAPKERVLPLVQRYFNAPKQIAARAARLVRSKLEYYITSPETGKATARALASHAAAGLVLEAAAGTSDHGFAPKERCLSPA